MNDNRAEVIDLQEIWENLLRQFALEQENALPAVVTSYDRAKNLVTCRPAVNRLGVNGESQQRAEVVVPRRSKSTRQRPTARRNVPLLFKSSVSSRSRLRPSTRRRYARRSWMHDEKRELQKAHSA